jgi:hypothetical protein
VIGISRVIILPGTATVRIVSDRGARDLSIRHARRYDELAAQLGELLQVPASIFEGPGLPEPGAGTIVLCRPDGLHRLATSRRGGLDSVLLLDASRPSALRDTEIHGLAGAVESATYGVWADRRSPSSPPAMYGRLAVASELSAVLDKDPVTQGACYGRFQIPFAPDVPSMLAAYLRCYTVVTT